MTNFPKNISEDLLFALLDNPYECLVFIDDRGIVKFISRSNEGIYPVSVKDAIGRHINEVHPESNLPRVLETGKAETDGVDCC